MSDPAETLQQLAREYPSLFDEAYQAVREGKVKKYCFYPSGKVEWIVVGRNRDYLILPEANYCSCEDFFFRVLSQEKPMCYHILAVRIATLTGRYEEIQEADHWRRRLIKEWIPREE
ncbi:MAG: SWIM zinc finger family protein [Aigarchaeota archaeon]|nr:SWIM zinc finger family protein [Candidatus Pelearchaeum maunauluense]